MAETLQTYATITNGTQITTSGVAGSSLHFESAGGPLFANSVVTGNTLIWHSNGPKPRSLFDWLSNIKYWLHHEEMCKDLHVNTGKWLLNREEFATWRSATESSVLWLHGIPGCGKSKLVAHVINYMKPTMNPAAGSFAYFYCLRDAQEEERSRPEEVIRSLVRQLSFTGTDQKVLKEPAKELYEFQKESAIEHGSETVDRLTLQQSVELLVALLEGSSTVIVIDAIDELKDEERWRLFDAFDKILENLNCGNVRLFVSSRDDRDIKMKLSEYANVYIRATDNQEDVQQFINAEVDKAIRTYRLLRGAVPTWLKEEIITTLVDGAQGMFRWVSLQIQALCSPSMRTARAVKDALRRLPETLEDSYQVVYRQILDLDPDACLMAKNAVRWLLCAKRQLSSSEFLAALSASKFEERSPLPDEGPQHAIEELLDICCNLIVLDEGVDTFRMAHLSVREFFEKQDSFSRTDANTLALDSCIDTLMTSAGYNGAFNDFESYAAVFWPEHCQELGSDGLGGSLIEKTKSFLFNHRKTSASFEHWAKVVNQELGRWGALKRAQRRKLEDSVNEPFTPQFVACSYGLCWILKEMRKIEIFDLNKRVRCNDTGFNLAAIWGYTTIAEEFLDAGAEIDVPGNEGRTPLIIAAEHGHMDLVQLLILRGANLNTVWASGANSLHEAVWWGQYAIAEVLLKAGADHTIPDKHKNTPLMTSLRRDRRFIPGVFYDGDTSITPDKKDGNTGIFYSGDMMRLLLDYGANPCDPVNRTTLCEAVKASHTDAVKWFVEYGADVNSPDSGEERPLDYALAMGICGAIGTLVNHGATPGLKWETKTYHLGQWKKETWYPKLLEVIQSSTRKTPAPFISMPETTETRVSRNDEVVVTSATPDMPYLWIAIPPNISDVTQIKFTIESHDQGWSDQAHRLGGTYEQSYTWFEVGFSFTSSTRHSLPRREIQHNMHARWEYHTHVITFDAEDRDSQIRDLLATLKPGDSVQVFAKAAFPGWANYVKGVEIEILGTARVEMGRKRTWPKL